MKIFGLEILKRETLQKTIAEAEKRGVSIGPTNGAGIPYGSNTSLLSTDAAMKLSAVYRCVDVKGNDIATMTKDIFVNRGDVGWDVDENHYAHNLLNTQPSELYSSFVFWKSIVSSIEINGNGYAKIHRNPANGDPMELEYLTGMISMYIRPDRSVFYIYVNPYMNTEEQIEGEDMLHFKNFSYDGLVGVSTLTHATNIMGLSAAADAQAKGFFASGANGSGILSVPGKITDTKAAALKASFQTALAYDSTTGVAGGVAVLEQGAEFKAFTINPKDSQLIETRTFNVVDICRFFGVHPSKAFATSDPYANAETHQLGYVTDTMTPYSFSINNEINRKLLRPSQRRRTKVILRIDDLMSADLDTLANYYTKMFQLGTYTPNMICKKIKIPGSPEGNKRYVQVNLAPLGEEVKAYQNKNAGPGQKGNSNTNDDGEGD